jgi:hypothetical protein
MIPIRAILPALVVGFLGAGVAAQPDKIFPPLDAATATGWRNYVAATQQRIDGELKSPTKFLALDFGASAAADRQAILKGEMPIAEMHTQASNGRALDVPDAWVHHWRGAVFVRGVSLTQVFQRLQAEVPGIGKGDVVEARIVSGGGGPRLHTFIKLQRRGTYLPYHFVYHTEHDVLFTRQSDVRGTSTSTATKIAELSNPGSPQEREFPAGEDNRLLQRWNSYWRYEEGPAGVIVECESITLSRSVIFGIGRGIAAQTARESMEKALVNLRGHFATPGRTRPGLSPAR